jgi:hypothetical protein
LSSGGCNWWQKSMPTISDPGWKGVELRF